jgi:thiopeptide-type bacteriocin biosynthesis protein
VGIGSLGRRTAIATGTPRAHGHLSWARISALGRSLLAHPQVRARSKVRLGPSVIAGAESVLWLGPAREQGFLEEARSAIDQVVGAVLEGAVDWTDWPTLRRQVMGAVVEEQGAPDSHGGSHEDSDADSDEDSALADSIDDLLLTMVDDGLLHSDLAPPLIGPLPATWMIERLSRLAPRHGDAGIPPIDAEIAEALLDGPDSLIAQLATATADAAAGHVAQAASRLAAWSLLWADATRWAPSGAVSAPDDQDGDRNDGFEVAAVEAILRFDGPSEVVVAAAVIERAAALAPLLFRLQEALAPPVAERVPGPALADALAAVTECFGEGALDLAELATGAYGVAAGPDHQPGGDDDHDGTGWADETPPPAPLLTLLINSLASLAAVADSSRAGDGSGIREIRFTSEALDAVLPDHLSAPPTCELFLTPSGAAEGRHRAPPRSADPTDGPADGSGWLLGLHAPAGASWGRFGHALGGEERARLFPPLVAAEREARPGEDAADVAYCPHPSLGDLCAHPPFRPHALALTHWPSALGAAGAAAEHTQAAARLPQPQGATTHAPRVSTASTLELCADSAAPEPLVLRVREGGPFAPSPMHRVRSTTAPPGIWRLLAGWRLCRQHAPWSMAWGPLGGLDRLPRVWVDGFVIAPASWRIPAALAQPQSPATLDRELSLWREREALPRFVQVGREDELLPVDLASPLAHAELRGHDRVFEIWPPMGDTPDETGRRIELVVALVDRPNAEARAHLEGEAARVGATGSVLPPRRRSGLDDGAGWTTFKLFGVTEAQDGLLLDVVGRAVQSARETREIDGWFFQRYVDPPGRRAHLRLRVHVAKAMVASAFVARLEAHLAETGARARGAVVSLETTPYFPEAARYGGTTALPFVHALFEADSDFVLGCLLEEAGDDGGDANAEVDGLLQGDQHADFRLSRTLALLTGLEALALGLGLDLEGRRALAARRRNALLRAFFDPRDGEPATTARAGWPKVFRALKPLLRARLAAVAQAFPKPPSTPKPASKPRATSRSKTQRAESAAEPSPSRSLLAYAGKIARIAPKAKSPGHLHPATPAIEGVLPALLHVNAVRMLGPDRVGELQAYTFWERTLESLAQHPTGPGADMEEA